MTNYDRNKREQSFGDLATKLWSYDRDPNETDHLSSRNITFQVTDDCSLACSYCLIGGTQVLMADLTTKNIEDIQIGDLVMAYDEFPIAPKEQVKLRIAKVEKTYKREINEEIYNIKVGSNEIFITGEHKLPYRTRMYKKASSVLVNSDLYTTSFSSTTIKDIDSYDLGYLIGIIVGDGSLKAYHYESRGNGLMYKFRIAMKDDEAIKYSEKCLKKYNIDYYKKPFLISEKDNIWKDAIFSSSRGTNEKLNELIKQNLNINTDESYLKGFLSGIYDAEGHLGDNNTIRISQREGENEKQIVSAIAALGFDYTYDIDKETENHIVKTIRIMSPRGECRHISFLEVIKPKITRKLAKIDGHRYIKKTVVTEVNKIPFNNFVYNIETTEGTYIANNVLVHNCYQHHKGKRSMSLDTAKAFIDTIIREDNGEYDNIVLDFIGGEPFLEIDLISDIVDYWNFRLIEEDHRWIGRYRISICSNGMHNNNPKVQEFIRKNINRLSFTITIDGHKELHDSCRVTPTGEPSYDIAYAASQDFKNKYGMGTGTKVTIAPANLIFLFHSIKHFIEQGEPVINANCVFEEGWTDADGTEFYNQLKRLSDFIIDNGYYNVYLSLFEESDFKPMAEEDNNNWCWGKGTPILTDKGYKPIEEIEVGDMVLTDKERFRPVVNTMKREAGNMVSFKTSLTEELFCTDNHKLFVINEDYTTKEVNKITKEDYIIYYKEGKRILINEVNFSPAAKQIVYNITVEEDHSYIAGGIVSANCGGNGQMLAMDPDGTLYPCLRYMESSVGYEIPTITCGDAWTGIDESKLSEMRKITRRSQSTDECFYCPVAKGCAWCTAYHLEKFGTINKRATFICPMHKTRALANSYYWNKLYKKLGLNKSWELHLPKEQALKFIDEDEWNLLKFMEEENKCGN